MSSYKLCKNGLLWGYFVSQNEFYNQRKNVVERLKLFVGVN